MSILFLSILLASVGGFIVLTYQSLARAQGWPVGMLFNNVIFQLLFGLIAIIGSTWEAISNISILGGFGVLIGGFIFAFILSFLFKSIVQSLAIILIITSFTLQFLI